jgi:hypothetical protein
MFSFLNNPAPGKTMVTRWRGVFPYLQFFWIEKLTDNPVEYFLNKEKVSKANDKFLAELRSMADQLIEFDDDTIFTNETYFGIGSVTGMMSGAPVTFASMTSWCSPNLDPDKIKVALNPDNPYIALGLMITQDLIDKWEGDYAIMPYFYRSPLDSAFGFLGENIFYLMKEDPEVVYKLAMDCAEWCLDLEDYFRKNLKWPQDLLRGVWSIALPDGAVVVNGDPVDLISAEMENRYRFNHDSIEKFFTNTAGGVFHHHALGMHQVENVGNTDGMLIHEITVDPNVENPSITIIKDEEIRNKVIAASLKKPILIIDDFLPVIDQLIPVLKQGRFILGQNKTENLKSLLQKLEENGLR